jgi:hypothetical protein
VSDTIGKSLILTPMTLNSRKSAATEKTYLSQSHSVKSRITTAYVEGLAWVLHYYYQGVCLYYFGRRMFLPVSDPILAVVLSVSFRSVCCRLPGHRQNATEFCSWAAFQTVRAAYGCFPSLEVSSPDFFFDPN